MRQFPVRNLNVYSAKPLIIRPLHYWGAKGHISDTGDAPAIMKIVFVALCHSFVIFLNTAPADELAQLREKINKRNIMRM